MDASMEDLMDRSRPPITSCVNKDLQNVSRSGAAVRIGVTWVNCHAVDEPFVLSQLAVHAGELAELFVHCPKFDGVVVTSDELVANGVVKLDVLALLLKLSRGRTVCL